MNSKNNDNGALWEYILGNPNLDVVESHLACPNQVLEDTNLLRTLASVPNEPFNLVTECPIET